MDEGVAVPSPIGLLIVNHLLNSMMTQKYQILASAVDCRCLDIFAMQKRGKWCLSLHQN